MTVRAVTASPATLPLLVLLLTSSLWGLAWLPLKALAAHGLGGLPLVAVAGTAAALVLLPALWRQRAQWRGQGSWLLLIAVVGGFANVSFTAISMYGDVVRVMSLFYLVPVWGVLGGRLFLHERIAALRVASVLLALGGAWLILGGFEAWSGSIHWTEWLAIGCGIAFVANNIVFRARRSIPVASKTTAMLAGAAVMAAVALALKVQPWPSLPVPIWASATGYGLVWLLGATLGTQFGATHLEAGRSSVIIVMELVVAVASAVLLGGARPGAAELAGGALILTAALLEARRG